MKSTSRDDYQQIRRPVGAMAKEFPRGFFSDRHRHARAQLLYAVSGVLEVWSSAALWVIPPQRAMWLPSGIDHEVHFKTAASVRTLYIDPEVLPVDAPDSPCAVNVSPLLRELILRAVAMPIEYDEFGRDGRIVALAIEEIEWTQIRPLYLPAFSDVRLERIRQSLQRNPADSRCIDEWAFEVNVSGRTLARIFQAEIGMSFGQWRQQLRVLAALPRLAAGESVTHVALDLGYETPSAFAATFRRLMGTVPSRYFPSAK